MKTNETGHFFESLSELCRRGVPYLLFFPALCHAADFEATLTSLVTAVIGRILPIFGLYYCGETALAFAQDRPEAKDKAKTVAIGVVALLGINAVWAWLKSHVR